MRVVLGLVGLASAVLLIATFSRVPPMGPEKPAKPEEAGPQGASAFVADSVDWLSWTEDEAVARIVDAPLKWMGTGSFDPDVRPELKPLMERAEERVRAALREVASGDIDTATARERLEAASAEYVSALEALAAAR